MISNEYGRDAMYYFSELGGHCSMHVAFFIHFARLSSGCWFTKNIPSLKRIQRVYTWKWMIGIRLFPFGGRPIFRGDMLVSGSVLNPFVGSILGNKSISPDLDNSLVFTAGFPSNCFPFRLCGIYPNVVKKNHWFLILYIWLILNCSLQIGWYQIL